MEPHYFAWYTHAPDRTLFDPSAFSLQSLFPLPNDGVIKRNRCYLDDEVYRYLYMQCVTVNNALTRVFDGGVYFLWDRRRELMKIGCSQNLEKRIRQLFREATTYAINDDLQLIGIHPTSADLVSRLEAYYHRLFQDHAYKYEWFRLSLEQFEEIMCGPFSTFVSTYFLGFWLFYSTVDLIPPEMDTILDIWPYSKHQVYTMLNMDELMKQEITLLVQDHKGNILPFGWKQNDTAYLNEKNIWENPHLVCFQKLRMLALHDARRMESFADRLLF